MLPESNLKAAIIASIRVGEEDDLLLVRQTLRKHAREAGLGLVDETKVITAASELARNILKYSNGAGGRLRVELLERSGRKGVRATFEDSGPGIEDVALALKDGYSTGGSLGLGLPGAKRLVDEFSIESTLNRGTTVQITKWAR